MTFSGWNKKKFSLTFETVENLNWFRYHKFIECESAEGVLLLLMALLLCDCLWYEIIDLVLNFISVRVMTFSAVTAMVTVAVAVWCDILICVISLGALKYFKKINVRKKCKNKKNYSKKKIWFFKKENLLWIFL